MLSFLNPFSWQSQGKQPSPPQQQVFFVPPPQAQQQQQSSPPQQQVFFVPPPQAQQKQQPSPPQQQGIFTPSPPRKLSQTARLTGTAKPAAVTGVRFVERKYCAGCLTFLANPWRDLCQNCFIIWNNIYDRQACLRCGSSNIEESRDLCGSCYAKWKSGKLHARNYEKVITFDTVEDELDDLVGVYFGDDDDDDDDDGSNDTNTVDTSGLWEEVKDMSIFGPDDCCPICLDNFLGGSSDSDDDDDVVGDDEPMKIVRLRGCKHCFHEECIKHCVKDGPSLKCPSCGDITGRLVGNQPPGIMIISLKSKGNLEGDPPGTGYIKVIYVISDGVQGKSHPNPGVQYKGAIRPGFFPNTPEGRKVVRLIRVAFLRRLVFTVGRSVTNGKDNQTVWNGIHHKTYKGGGAEKHGYPDPTYLTRVQEELASFNITESKLAKSTEEANNDSGSANDNSNNGKVNKKAPTDETRNDRVVTPVTAVSPQPPPQLTATATTTTTQPVASPALQTTPPATVGEQSPKKPRVTAATKFCEAKGIVISNQLITDDSYPTGSYLPTDI